MRAPAYGAGTRGEAERKPPCRLHSALFAASALYFCHCSLRGLQRGSMKAITSSERCALQRKGGNSICSLQKRREEEICRLLEGWRKGEGWGGHLTARNQSHCEEEETHRNNLPPFKATISQPHLPWGESTRWQRCEHTALLVPGQLQQSSEPTQQLLGARETWLVHRD